MMEDNAQICEKMHKKSDFFRDLRVFAVIPDDAGRHESDNDMDGTAGVAPLRHPAVF